MLATVLGVRRPSLTLALKELHSAGVVAYRLGQIVILGRTGLEATACECYAVVRGHLERFSKRRAGALRPGLVTKAPAYPTSVS